MTLEKQKLKLQKELYKLINTKGTTNPATVRKSQELDKIILKLQRGEK